MFFKKMNHSGCSHGVSVSNLMIFVNLEDAHSLTNYVCKSLGSDRHGQVTILRDSEALIYPLQTCFTRLQRMTNGGFQSLFPCD